MQMIPKILHQVWINPNNPELPEPYATYRDGWLALHPDWEYRIWNLDNLDFKPQNPHLLNSETLATQLSDILRYEVLYHHGGIYIDTDFECQKNIEPLLEGVQNFACSENGEAISGGILGAVKHSELMKACMDHFPQELGKVSPALETGPGFLTKVLLTYGFHNNLTIFPTSHFYPYGFYEPEKANEAFPEAYAVHRWAHSWKSDWDKKNTFSKRLRRFLIRKLQN